MKDRYLKILRFVVPLFILTAATLKNKCAVFGSDEVKIVIQPQDQTIALETPTEMSITAEGEDVGYQWLFRGHVLQGATSRVYTINNVSTNEVGFYQCVVHSGSATEFSKTVLLQAYSAVCGSTNGAVTLWSYPVVFPGLCDDQPAAQIKSGPQINVPANGSQLNLQFKKGNTSIENAESSEIGIQFAALRRQPRMMFIDSPTNAPVVVIGSGSVGLPGNANGCPYVGYVNFSKPAAPYGWQPISGVSHNAHDPNRGDTCIKFFGSTFNNNGVGTGGNVVVSPVVSVSYRFTVYFPSNLPTYPYSLELTGFYP